MGTEREVKGRRKRKRKRKGKVGMKRKGEGVNIAVTWKIKGNGNGWQGKKGKKDGRVGLRLGRVQLAGGSRGVSRVIVGRVLQVRVYLGLIEL